MRKLFLSMLMSACAVTGFAQKTLVLYYSENGTTKTVAEELQKQLGADIEAVEAVEAYTGDFQATVQRGNKERESGQWPAIKPLKKKIADYSGQKPVTAAEKALFDEACSSYQFPLGTPETVGKRATDDGTDYKFSVKSRGMDGKEATSTIYVTVEKGAKAEFTEVVR